MTQGPSQNQLPPELTVEQVAELVRSKAAFRLIDVREPWEREIVSIEGSEPLDEGLIERILKSGRFNEQLVFMCHHGIRSLNAAAFFAAQGFTDVYSMNGGIEAWADRIDPNLARY